ncbi:MAG: nucleoside monophosphate kinase [Parcubacteria group bacterium]
MMLKDNQALTIIFMGPSGSGKGTQAALLSEKFGFEFVEMGGIIRAEAKKDTELGKKVYQIVMMEGRLLPDDLTYQLLENKILDVPAEKNLIVDGYPRTVQQVGDFYKLLAKANRKHLTVFNVTLSDEAVLERLSKRLVCDNCQTVFIASKDNKKGSKCAKCGGKLIRRSDDTPAKIKARLQWAHEQVEPAIEEFKKKGVLVDINGDRSIKEIQAELVGQVEKLLS